jgi:hypothetical protein
VNLSQKAKLQIINQQKTISLAGDGFYIGYILEKAARSSNFPRLLLIMLFE